MALQRMTFWKMMNDSISSGWILKGLTSLVISFEHDRFDFANRKSHDDLVGEGWVFDLFVRVAHEYHFGNGAVAVDAAVAAASEVHDGCFDLY